MAHGKPGSERQFAFVGLILFAIVTALLCSRHEPWHDELQAWRIGLDSRSLRDLLTNLRYEGHPPLFYVVLRGVGVVSRSWNAVVVLHWLLACASAWVVLRWSPFARLQRALIVAGYFVAYEYAVIVRPYGAGMLCALAACAAWCAPVRRTRSAFALLALLANTSAVGIVLAVPIAIALVVDTATDGTSSRWRAAANRRGAVAALVAALMLLITLGWLMLPPPDALFKGGFSGLWGLGVAFSTAARAIAPLAGQFPDGVTAWNTWAFAQATRTQIVLADLSALVIVIVGAVITSRRMAALVLWLTSCGALIMFFSVVYLGGMRHHGYIVVALFAAAWLAYAPARGDSPDRLHRLTARLEPFRRSLFTILLVPMVVPTLQVGVAEFRDPFADASEIATLIAQEPLARLPVVGMSYPWSQSVAALLDRPIYMSAEERYSTFVARINVVEGGALAVRTDSAVQSLFVGHCEVIVLTGKDDQALIDLRSARRVRASHGTPMSSHPLDVWVLTAPRCRRPVLESAPLALRALGSAIPAPAPTISSIGARRQITP